MDPDQKLLQDQGHPGKNCEISFVTKTLGVMNGSRNQSNNKDLDKNINFHFLDLTVTFYAFDFNSYECSPDEVNGGSGVVP